MTSAAIQNLSPSSNRIANVPGSNGAFHQVSTKQNFYNGSDPLIVKVAETSSERAAAFRLVHQVYFQAGLTVDNALQMRVLDHHLIDTTDVLVGKRYGHVDFTTTLVGDSRRGLPAESLFGVEIQSLRSEGIRLAEVSCVASSCADEDKKQRFETLVKMISLTLQVARRRGVDRLLLAVHPRHARVYQRLFGCVACTDVKQYQAVQGNPAVLCVHDFAELDLRRYPLYDQIYGASYRPWQMDGTKMSAEEKRYFRRAVQRHACQLVPMAA